MWTSIRVKNKTKEKIRKVECIIKHFNPSVKNIRMSYEFLILELIDYIEKEANKHGFSGDCKKDTK